MFSETRKKVVHMANCTSDSIKSNKINIDRYLYKIAFDKAK